MKGHKEEKKMKVLTRNKLRGSKLIKGLCERASTYRLIVNNNICLIECGGAMDEMTDDRWPDCENCGALGSNLDVHKYVDYVSSYGMNK